MPTLPAASPLAPSPLRTVAFATMSDAPAIRVEAVRKSYRAAPEDPPTHVLRGVSLRVEAGEFVSLMGASGSGKTTLLNLIGGLDTPDEGTIAVHGESVHAMDDDVRSEFRLRRVGFVFQFFNLLPNLSVLENVAMPLLLLRMREAEAHGAAAALAEEVGLGEKLRRAAHQLSGGEMQRVALARALVHRPALLLADEPTGNLDSRTGESILALLRTAAKERGTTVLMATHDMHAASVSDRTVRMADGLVVG